MPITLRRLTTKPDGTQNAKTRDYVLNLKQDVKVTQATLEKLSHHGVTLNGTPEGQALLARIRASLAELIVLQGHLANINMDQR